VKLWFFPADLIVLAKELVNVNGENLHRYDPTPTSVVDIKVALPRLTVLRDPLDEPRSSDAVCAEEHFFGWFVHETTTQFGAARP
jgi:hypothetical protein